MFDPNHKEDPVAMYLVVRESLKMSVGKSCVSVGHAVQLVMMMREELETSQNIIRQVIVSHHRNDSPLPPNLPKQICEITNKLATMQDWLDSGYRKIVLKADDAEWEKLMNELDSHGYVVVIDAGLVEVPEGSMTCLGIFPIRKSKRCKTLKRLRAL